MNKTGIEWTDITWNPVRGCSRKSKGCMHCYAEQQAMRIVRMDRGRGIPEGQGAYDGLIEMTSQGPKWTGKIREVYEALDAPLRMKKPRRIFVNSMSDLFHPNVTDEFIAEVLAHAAYARQHTFQILTKCPERMQQLLTSQAFMELYEDTCSSVCVMAEEILAARGEFRVHHRLTTDIRAFNPEWPPANIQLGVSVEDQATADERIPLLLATPAAVRFISAEPLLGPVDIKDFMWPVHGWWRGPHRSYRDAKAAGEECGLKRQALVSAHAVFLDWVIAGGESGSGARPSHTDWYRSLRDQCAAAEVSFLFKQWGEWLPWTQFSSAAGVDDPLEQTRFKTLEWKDDVWVDVGYPDVWATRDGDVDDEQCVGRVGKKAAGRLLDGIEHNGFPS